MDTKTNTDNLESEILEGKAKGGVAGSDADIEEVFDKSAAVASFIREQSANHQTTNAEVFLEAPFSLEVEELLALLDELKLEGAYKDIYSIKGEKTIYLFSNQYITHNYANMMVMVEERDLIKLVAETVRYESKTYPRPTDVRLFYRNPFKLSVDIFKAVLKQLKETVDYDDIKETKASNNAVYLYSDKFMDRSHATSLAEWVEVEADQNP